MVVSSTVALRCYFISMLTLPMMLPIKAFSTPMTPVVHLTALPVLRSNLLLWNLQVMQGPPASSVISPAEVTAHPPSSKLNQKELIKLILLYVTTS
jgi:hypothetical protein